MIWEEAYGETLPLIIYSVSRDQNIIRTLESVQPETIMYRTRKLWFPIQKHYAWAEDRR